MTLVIDSTLCVSPNTAGALFLPELEVDRREVVMCTARLPCGHHMWDRPGMFLEDG
jgi:hypothetical protein